MWTLAGKQVVVTGATSGIGLETAAVIAAQGADVAIVGRDAGRLEAAAATIAARTGRAPATYRADFASLASVEALGASLMRDLPALHVLINNAGAVFAARTRTADGHEATFAVNHLAAFLLTERVRPLLEAGAPARVITVASGRHFKGAIDFDDLGMERGYQVLRAYARSKLANVLFASELARRSADTGVTSVSVHPGRVATNIWSGAPRWARPLIRYWLSRTFIPVEQGAAPIVALAGRPDLPAVNGGYFDRFEAVPASPAARDAALAARLWDESARLTAV